MTMQNYTHIEVILDRSGSMSSCLDSTIEGLNKFIMDQKKVEGKCTMTQVQFDDAVEIHYHYLDISMVPFVNRQNYIPRANTALRDAIGKTITRLGQELAMKPEELRPSKVIVLIQTDGQENASREFSQSQIYTMTKHQQDKYGWEFIFAGTNQDAVTVAASYSIPLRSAIYYSNTDYGTSNVWASVSNTIADSRVYGCAVNFTDSDRAATVDPNDMSGWSGTAAVPTIMIPTVTVPSATIVTTATPVIPTTTNGSTT